MPLKNKVAIITGAASGIGKAIALVYAKAGAKVAVADLNLSEANQTVKEIQNNGGEATTVRMNVIDEKEVDTGVDSVVKKFGGVDILVSNAGIQIISPLEQLSYDNWKKLLAIHLDGAFLTTRACLRHMYSALKFKKT